MNRDLDVLAGGVRLRARRFGPPGPEPAATLVFLHEGLGSISQWKDFPAALAEAAGLPAVVYDRYGYGASEARMGPPDPGYFQAEALVRLPDLLAALDVRRPFLVGHSDGGTIALLFAAAFPDRPRGLITEAAHVFVEDEAVEGIRRALRAFENFPFRDHLARHHGAKVDSTFHGWSDVWLAPAHQSWHMRDRLGAITAPVLAIQGEDDEYGTPAQVAAIVAGVAGPARALLLPACGHAPHLQARDRVLPAMAAFIGETLASAPLITP